MNNAPRFAETFCSQCGAAFGPGDHGYSHCADHTPEADAWDGEPVNIAGEPKSDLERAMDEAMGPRKNPLHPKFEYHNCAYCRDGELPCKQGNPNRCDNPRARND